MGLFGRRDLIHIPTARCYLRLPERRDHLDWARLRRESADFLRIWEPVWAQDHFSKQSFKNRVYWARRVFAEQSAIPLFIFRQTDDALLGGITLDNIRRGPSQSATLGYWIGQEYARQGYMSEAIMALVAYSFSKLELSRIEAATLAQNKPSRGVLEKSGFKYEGVAQSYLQIDGKWRNHVLYANLRSDRRGKTGAGVE